jgi:magnesium transporter
MSGSPINIIHYDRDSFEEKKGALVAECDPYASSPGVTWINTDSLTDISVIKSIGECFDLHDLTIEDIPQHHTPRQVRGFRQLRSYHIEMLSYSRADRRIDAEQLSLAAGAELRAHLPGNAGDFFEGLRQEIRKATPLCTGWKRLPGLPHHRYYGG